jgi:hypothetical protein
MPNRTPPRWLFGLLVLVAAGTLFVFLQGSNSMTTTLSYSWTPPTTGTPVARYEVFVQFDTQEFSLIDSTTTVPHVEFPAPLGKQVVVMVRGVDANGHRGPFSQPSEPFTAEVPDP